MTHKNFELTCKRLNVDKDTALKTAKMLDIDIESIGTLCKTSIFFVIARKVKTGKLNPEVQR